MANNRILSEKLESLLQGIHEQYGNALTDELIARLEYTIADFNEEIDSLMNDLKENASLKEKLMEYIKSGKTEEKTVDPTEYSAEEVKEMSEWEKRLESLS
jgi:plasmid rolling circle replication initiator protein Rep